MFFLSAQPMHWIYNPDRLKEVLSDLEPYPEFRPESANPFYRRATGEQTCYGDQAYVLLESLSQCGGTAVDPKPGFQTVFFFFFSFSVRLNPFLKILTTTSNSSDFLKALMKSTHTQIQCFGFFL